MGKVGGSGHQIWDSWSMVVGSGKQVLELGAKFVTKTKTKRLNIGDLKSREPKK